MLTGLLNHRLMLCNQVTCNQHSVIIELRAREMHHVRAYARVRAYMHVCNLKSGYKVTDSGNPLYINDPDCEKRNLGTGYVEEKWQNATLWQQS